MKRIRGDSDFPSIPRKGFNSETPLRQPDPVDHLTTLWTNKKGSQDGSGVKRSRILWMSEGLERLQLDPLDHHFDPEGQVPTLWVRTS
jgi:hypothetical protein